MNGVVVFVDFLGTKKAVDEESCRSFFSNFKIIRDELDRAFKSLKENYQEPFRKVLDGIREIPAEFSTPPLMKYFQDTIIITWPFISAPDRIENCLTIMGEIIKILFLSALEKGLLLRGAVSYGDVFRDADNNTDEFYLGPAVTDVAEWYEQADWAGVILTPKTGYYLDSAVYELTGNDGKFFDEINSAFMKYLVPVKGNNGKYQLWSVNWPKKLLDGCEVGVSENEAPADRVKRKLGDYYSYFTKNKSVPAEVLAKFESTHSYLNWYIEGVLKQDIQIGQPQGAAPTKALDQR